MRGFLGWHLFIAHRLYGDVSWHPIAIWQQSKPSWRFLSLGTVLSMLMCKTGIILCPGIIRNSISCGHLGHIYVFTEAAVGVDDIDCGHHNWRVQCTYRHELPHHIRGYDRPARAVLLVLLERLRPSIRRIRDGRTRFLFLQKHDGRVWWQRRGGAVRHPPSASRTTQHTRPDVRAQGGYPCGPPSARRSACLGHLVAP